MLHKWHYLLFLPLFANSASSKLSLNIQSLQIINPPLKEYIAQSESSKNNPKSNYCSQDIELLTDSLLQDLPGYGNRIIQRTQNISQEAGLSIYIVVAGRKELEPLGLPQINYSDVSTDSNTKQVFFTTLERSYVTDNTTTKSPTTRKLEREIYHWLFLAPTNQGWRMVAMYSRFGASAKDQIPTPPQETSNGIIGQAVELWLKDCRAGVKEIEEVEELNNGTDR